jgi:hypothetical protein
MAESQDTQAVQYRLIPGYPDYRIGDDGSVWTSKQQGKRAKWRLLAQAKMNGYMVVGLCNPGFKQKMFRVHQLMLMAFVGPRPDGMEGCHNNGVRNDNRLSNLRWDTHVNNESDKEQHGTVMRGDIHGSSKLRERDIPVVRKMLASGISVPEVAKKFGVAKSTIGGVKYRKAWKHIP